METAAISHRVADFLKQHPPFQAMGDGDLLELSRQGIRVPDDAVLAQVLVERTSAVVSVEVSDRGLSVLPLSQLGTTSEVADVRPAQR